MSRACTPPLGLGEESEDFVIRKGNRSGFEPRGVVLLPPQEGVAERNNSSPSAVVPLSCNSDDKEEICLTQLQGAATSASSQVLPPLTHERVLELRQCASDHSLIARTPANAAALLDQKVGGEWGGRTGTPVAGAVHFGDHTNHIDDQRRERVMSWLAGTSAGPIPPRDSAGDAATSPAPEGSGISEGSHTPSHRVASAPRAPFLASTPTHRLPRGGTASVSLRSPTGAEPSSPSTVVPLWGTPNTRTPASYSFTEWGEGVDESTPSVRRRAPLRRTRLLGGNGDCRDACHTPPSAPRHPWNPSERHVYNAEEVAVVSSDQRTASAARDSPWRTPPPLASLLLPFMASPPPRRPSILRESAKECPAPSLALSDATQDAENRKVRPAAVATAPIPCATNSHSDGEKTIALRVCTLSGLTLRVRVDRCLSVAVLAQRVAQYLQLRGAQVQLKYTRTGGVFDAASSFIKGPKASSATMDRRLCDLPGLQPSDVFVVLLRAQRGEPSSSLLPSRLSTAGRVAGRSPSLTHSSTLSRVRPPRRHIAAAKRPRQSMLPPPMPALTIAESPPALVGSHAAGGVCTDASVPSRKSQLQSVSSQRSSRTRCAQLRTPSPLGFGMHSSLAPAAAPAARAVSSSQGAASTAASAYAASGPAGERSARASACSYCYPPLMRSQTRQR